jgi:dihydrofolate reductase
MPKLIYSAITSLDGYTEDATGSFDWAAPNEEVHAFVNELERSIGTYLYGRRMYEVMSFWETTPSDAGEAPAVQAYAGIWQAADKVVYSRTLKTVSTAKTRIEQEFEPDTVRQMKAQAERDMSIGGPELAAQALRAGLVDELQLFLFPVLVGAGKPSLPSDIRVQLELLDERRFGNGVVHLHYRL